MKSKKTTQKHQTLNRTLHIHRIAIFAFLFVGLFGIQTAYSWQKASAAHVLAYATNINHSDLHGLTNQERAANGLPGLTLDSKLNQAAQAKADHMLANNYWAHVSPDGVTPWYFFDSVGYDYQTAGENLAYGFDSSAGVTQGWMNSPGHKANILGDYRDIGFGYASGPYQGGNYTIVVAMYGSSLSSSIPATPVPATLSPNNTSNPEQLQTKPAPTPTSTQQVQEPAPSASEESPAAAPSTPTTPVDTPPTPPETPGSVQNPVQTADEVIAAQALANGTAPWPIYGSLFLLITSTIGFGITHVRLMRLRLSQGMRYISAHPLMDAAVAGSISLTFLSATIGYIR